MSLVSRFPDPAHSPGSSWLLGGPAMTSPEGIHDRQGQGLTDTGATETRRSERPAARQL